MSLQKRVMATLMAAGLMILGGCSDDTSAPPVSDQPPVNLDQGPGGSETSVRPEAGGGDGPVMIDCTGKADGFECGTGMICLSNTCGTTMCGDKYVDAKNGEDCDDANSDPTDGCDSCKYSCKADKDCDDAEVCTGTETCDTTAHKCKAGTLPADGSACTLTGGGAGVCNAGTCTTPGCGNKVKDGTEECDDGNKVEGDGCDNDCTFSCKADKDCDDLDKCNGAETCDLATHKCKAGTALTCDDSKACTTDTCDAVKGCVNTPIDADGDGHSCEQDCKDNDPTIFVGAPDCPDGKDNDCNGKIDDGPAVGSCWPDKDFDTYGVVAGMVPGCVCPKGYTNRDPSLPNSLDCQQHNPDVNPGQLSYFPVGYCPFLLCAPGSIKSFDYNCDKVESPRWTTLAGASCTKLLKTCLGSGWVGGKVPECGGKADYKTCSLNLLTQTCTTSYITGRIQECR